MTSCQNSLIFFPERTESTGSDSLNNDGYGFAKGLELFWRDKKHLKI
jgi:hypothetical protein